MADGSIVKCINVYVEKISRLYLKAQYACEALFTQQIHIARAADPRSRTCTQVFAFCCRQ